MLRMLINTCRALNQQRMKNESARTKSQKRTKASQRGEQKQTKTMTSSPRQLLDVNMEVQRYGELTEIDVAEENRLQQ